MKGQISVETFLAVGALLLFFVIVSLAANNQNVQSTVIDDRLQEENSCQRIAKIAAALFSTDGDARITTHSNHDVQFLDNLVLTSNTFCNSTAKLIDSNASKGTIELFKDDSGVVVRNA